MEKKVFFTKDNEEIVYFYSNDKSKKNLVLIHGNLSSMLQWEEIIEEYKDEFNILAPTLRGFGMSSYKNPITSIEDLARDIEELIKFLDLKDLIILGWSLGGGVAMELAYLLRERTKKLILSASIGVKGFTMYSYNQEDKQFDFSKTLQSLDELRKSPYYLPQQKMIEDKNVGMIRVLVQRMFGVGKATEGFINNFLQSAIRQRNLLELLCSMRNFNITTKINKNGVYGSGHIEKLDMPVLLLHGEKDTIISKRQSEMGKKWFVNARLILFDGAEHALHMDVWDEWNKEVRDFIVD